ncbi:MAG: EFR1 family ferrodoxin [Elusimicrobia bacterium]|nr:EFR1 family ferrodoxin [Candidatus Liberimonas magnetica]
MKTTIYYFTGTGNSLKVARDIAGGLGETELIPIAKAIKNDVKPSADRIGLIFPVYVWGVPVIVTNFVKKLEATDKYFFSVVTYGGMPASTVNQLKNLLRGRNIKLSAGFGVKMPGNYVPLYGAYPEKTCNELYDKEKNKIKEIIEYIKAGREGRCEDNSFIVNWIFSGIIYNLSVSKMHEASKKFWVKDTCTKCGLCEKICPVKNIRLDQGKPVWDKRCEQCLACIQWCPVEAIQFGKSTETRKRYRHPEIKVEDLFI